MKKLNLKLQDLAVESFPTQELVGQLGTVRANHTHDLHLCDTAEPWLCTADVSCDFGCNTAHDGTCLSGHTCQASCYGTCGETCRGCESLNDTCANTICCPSQPC